MPRIEPRVDCAEAAAATPSRRSAKKTNRGRAGRVPPPVVNRNVRMFFLLGLPPITGQLRRLASLPDWLQRHPQSKANDSR